MASIPDSAGAGLFDSLHSLADVIERTGNPRTGFDPRSSGHGQLSNGSQHRQLTAARPAIAEAGGQLVHIVRNGRPQPGRLNDGRLAALERAFEELARLNAHYTTFNVGRLLRADDSHGQRAPFVLGSPDEIATVLELAAEYGVIVATIDPPDLDGREIRSRDVKRGMKLGQRPGPLPDWIPPRKVRQIRDLLAVGVSLREIARRVGLSRRKVRAVLESGPGSYE